MTIIKSTFWKKGSIRGLHADTYFVDNPAWVKGALARYAKKKILGVDSETKGLDVLMPGAKTRLIQIADEVDVTIFDLWSLKAESIGWIFRFLEDPLRVKVIQNAKFDLKFWIHEHGAGEIAPLFDTQIVAQLIDLGDSYGKHDLGYLIEHYLGIKIDKEVNHDWTGQLSEFQKVYASNDVAHMVALRAALLAIAKELGILKKVGIELRAVQPTAQRELNGLLLDKEKWMGIYRENRKKLKEVERKLDKQLNPMVGDNIALFEGGPVSFNMNSTDQIKERLKAMNIKLPEILDRDTKKVKETILMDRLAQISSSNPVISTVIARARLSRATTSYGKKFLRWINPVTGRAHADIRQIGTPTCREAAKEPPLHGIPKESDHRECFIAPPGYKLVWADYSQIELRILAELSGDEMMLKAFNEGLDLHTQSASLIFNIDYDSVVAIQRRRAKDINFGKPYGVGPERFAQRAGISLKAAEKMMSDHDKKYKKSNAYLLDASSHARIYGWVRTMSGALITFKYNKNNKREVSAIGRYGRNYPIQGSSADITKTAMRYVHDGARLVRESNGFWPVKMVHVIHDEIVLEVRDDLVDYAKEMLHTSMVKAGEEYLKIVPCVVDVSVNTYWAKVKED